MEVKPMNVLMCFVLIELEFVTFRILRHVLIGTRVGGIASFCSNAGKVK
jgi:hypothetical protein